MQKSEKEKLVQKLRRAADAQRKAYSGNVYHDGIAQGLDNAAGILGKIRCEEEQHWIPCSERLPEDGEIVIVTAHFYGGPLVFRAYLEGGEWIGEEATHWDQESIRAWMPLPKPYEERRETDESD